MTNLKSKIKEQIWQARGVVLPSNPRCDDLYLVEYPKSGITWFSNIIAALMVDRTEGPGDRNYYLNDLIHDLHLSTHLPSTPVCHEFGHRVLKSHSVGNPYYLKVIYIVRHPVAVMSSYFDYLTNLGMFSGSFSNFIRDKRVGLRSWNAHVQSWVSDTREYQRISIVKYEALRQDPIGETQRVLRLMGLVLTDDRVSRAVSHASMDQMRIREERIMSGDMRAQFKRYETFRFVNKARMPGSVIITETDRQLVVDRCGDTARALGYEL